jgi:hypothetical protein
MKKMQGRLALTNHVGWPCGFFILLNSTRSVVVVVKVTLMQLFFFFFFLSQVFDVAQSGKSSSNVGLFSQILATR